MAIRGTGTGGMEISVAYLGKHQTYNPRAWFQSISFISCLIFLTNLTSLTNLLSHN